VNREKLTPPPGLEIDPSRRRPRLDISHLRTGLFVCDLDRPWLDTPFLLQGFLIETDQEIGALREHCRHVFIDRNLSDPAAIQALGDALQMPDDPDDAPRQSALARSQGHPRSPAANRSRQPDVDQALHEADPLATPVRPPTQPAARPPQQPSEARRELPPESGQSVRPVSPATAAASGRGEPAPRAHRSAGGRPLGASRETRERFRRFVLESAQDADAVSPRAAGGLIASLGGLFRRRGEVRAPDAQRGKRLSTEAATADDRRADTPQARLAGEIDALLAPGESRQAYEILRALPEELPRARRSFEHAASALGELLADVRSGKVFPLLRSQEAVADMVDSMLGNPDAMLWLAHLRQAHIDTYQHGVRTSLYMISVGRSLGLPKRQIEALGQIGLLADVGKIQLPRALLDKPGLLTPAEFRIAKEHVSLGLQALEADKRLDDTVKLGILQHHERLDGTGYPEGLKGEQISIYGRLAGIADTFSALVSARPYANATAAQDALMSLYQWADTSFHGPLVEQFVQSLGVFPVGTLVELSNDEVAVVLEHNRSRRLEPRVIVLADAAKRPLGKPYMRDLFAQARAEGVKPLRIHRGLPAGAYGLRPHDFYGADPAQLQPAR
jgi:HD-GYP domain-containing protein (c-di-GMP phosphodiesterase class II)